MLNFNQRIVVFLERYPMKLADGFELKFTSREVTAWGSLALLKCLLAGLNFKAGCCPSPAPTGATDPNNSSNK